jgi:Ca2+-binding RTX toxin-like protein
MVGDTSRGTNKADNLLGKGGDDRVLGLGGSDHLLGGTGNDIVFGGDELAPQEATRMWLVVLATM